MSRDKKLTVAKVLLMCTGLIIWIFYAVKLYIEAFAGSNARIPLWLITDVLEGFSIGAVCFGLAFLLDCARSPSQSPIS